ncbi:MAG: Trk system potassium transporter TrkA [Acidimicrobiaceae bacterium]|nr:Trk system potassium transporter TrkA [Acidimicrobiaceae bacterium]
MHVVVIGAGEVGSYIADRLSREGHDVGIIDIDREKVRRIGDDTDALTVCGSGTNPDTLRKAGVENADLLVAVTANDEVNLIASMLAKSIGVKQSIVRIEAAELRGEAGEEVRNACGADLIIDPDAETAQEVLELLDFQGADEVARMVGGEVVVIGARLPAHAPLVGRTLGEIAEEFEPDWDFMVAAIGRGDETIIPRKDACLQADDHVRVVAKRRARRLVIELLGLDKGETRRVLLLGGGRTAELLAHGLADRGVQVEIVERDPARARELAEALDDVRVHKGEITDDKLLVEIEIGRFGMVAALTGEDDANILACLFAKSAGARETIATVHRLELLKILRSAGVDVALSPRTATANGVLRFVRGGVAAVATFLHGDVEVLELEVQPGSPADGELVRDLGLPKDALIAASVRDGKPQIIRGRSRLRGRDHVVVVAMPAAVDAVRSALG